MAETAAALTATEIGDLIKKSSEAAARTAAQTMQYARTVQARQLPVYDYEKVFWNSTFTIGLVALGYAAIKLGQVIQTLQKIISLDFLPKQLAYYEPEYSDDFLYVYEWMEGYKKDTATPTLGGRITWGWSIREVNRAVPNYRYRLVYYYRTTPGAWMEWKTEFYEKGDLTEEDVQAHSEDITKRVAELEKPDVLKEVEKVYAQWGPIMPLAAIGGHATLEWFRIKKLKKEKR